MRTPIHLDFRRERALRSAAIVLAASLACLGGAAGSRPALPAEAQAAPQAQPAPSGPRGLSEEQARRSGSPSATEPDRSHAVPCQSHSSPSMGIPAMGCRASSTSSPPTSPPGRSPRSSANERGSPPVSAVRTTSGNAPAPGTPVIGQRRFPGSGAAAARGANPDDAAMDFASGHSSAAMPASNGTARRPPARTLRAAARARLSGAAARRRVSPPRASKASSSRRGGAPSASMSCTAAALPSGARPTSACSCRSGSVAR